MIFCFSTETTLNKKYDKIKEAETKKRKKEKINSLTIREKIKIGIIKKTINKLYIEHLNFIF